MCNSLSDCKGMQGLYGSRSYGTGKWEKNGYVRAFSQLRTLRRMGKKHEDLDYHEQDMPVQYARFISVKGDLV